MQICYVHGAGASEKSFVWLCEQLPEHKAIFFNYTVHESVTSVVARLSSQLTEPTVLVGHSLGGIIATLCSDLDVVQKLVTMCAPFGGVRHIDVLALFSLEPLFHDLRQHGRVLNTVRHMRLTKPHLAIVGTRGLPFMTEDNDGVVSVTSQTALSNTFYEMLPLNHFEMLLSDQVAHLITNFIRDLKYEESCVVETDHN